MPLVSISIYWKHAANVVHCAPGSHGTVRFQPRTAYPNGLILLEIDRSLGIGRADLLIFERPLGHANVTSLVERESR